MPALSFNLTIYFAVLLSPVIVMTGVRAFESEDKFRELFDRFKQKYNKSYGPDDTQQFENYRRNIEMSRIFQNADVGSGSYGEIEYSDSYPSRRMKTPMLERDKSNSGERPRFESSIQHQLTYSFDWRDKGVICPVENQRKDDTCVLFSVVGNLESILAIKEQRACEPLSKQQLLDCASFDAAFLDNGFEAVIQMGGLESALDYPYTGVEGPCRANTSQYVVRVHNYSRVRSSEGSMAFALATDGPISVAMNGLPLHTYIGGVIDLPSGCDDVLNHAVLIVGFGEENGIKFWIVKNSWGSNWGENGYFRIVRGKGMCGIDEEPRIFRL